MTAEGELPHPGSVREKADEETGHGHASAPLHVCVCTYGCAHAGHTRRPITVSQLDPHEYSLAFALLPKSIPYLSGPLELWPQQVGEARRRG